jgi:ribosomal protein L24
MANQQSQIVTIDGVEVKVEDMTEQQQMLLNHVADIERKIGSTKFQLDQLQVGRDAFFTMLKAALEAKPEEAEVTDVTDVSVQ